MGYPPEAEVCTTDDTMKVAGREYDSNVFSCSKSLLSQLLAGVATVVFRFSRRQFGSATEVHIESCPRRSGTLIPVPPVHYGEPNCLLLT